MVLGWHTRHPHPTVQRRQRRQRQLQNAHDDRRLKSTPRISLLAVRRRILTDELELDDSRTSVRVASRIVPIAPEWNVTIWELEKVAAVVEKYWDHDGFNHDNNKKSQQQEQPLLDPFGLVCWPGSVVAAQELMRHADRVVKNRRVLVLGAGVGIEAQAAAHLGATSVLATDIHPTVLRLLEYGSQQEGMDHIISTAFLDISNNSTDSQQPLPACDLMIVADVLYNDKLAAHVAWKCLQARSVLPVPPVILVTDSQQFVQNFEQDICSKMLSIGQPAVSWTKRDLLAFQGSGVMVDEDQTYDVHARIMWIGLTE